MQELLQHKPAEIVLSKNCGKKSISEIERKVFEYLGGDRIPEPSTTQGWAVIPLFKADLDVGVEQLCLSRRASSVVTSVGMTTVRQLVDAPKTMVAQSAACGVRTIAEIETKLRKYVEGGICCGIRVDAGTKALCESILDLLRQREQSVMRRRYGLWDGTFGTLESVGQMLGVTRERIRQIEGEVRKRLTRRIGRAVILFIRQKMSSCACSAWADLPENDVLDLFTDDCTADEARLALHFLQHLQPSYGFHFYDLNRIWAQVGKKRRNR